MVEVSSILVLNCHFFFFFLLDGKYSLKLGFQFLVMGHVLNVDAKWCKRLFHLARVLDCTSLDGALLLVSAVVFLLIIA